MAAILTDDFERGSDGDAVGGNWTLYNGATGIAEISTAYAYSGTRSLHIRRISSPEPYITTPANSDSAQYIEIMVYRADSSSGMNIEFGNGIKKIWFHFQPDGDCYYFDGYWRNMSYRWPSSSWNKLKLDNIDFDNGTYDIYRDSTLLKVNTPMYVNSTFENLICLKATNDSGSDIYFDDFVYKRNIVALINNMLSKDGLLYFNTSNNFKNGYFAHRLDSNLLVRKDLGLIEPVSSIENLGL